MGYKIDKYIEREFYDDCGVKNFKQLAEQRFDLAYSQACSKFTRIINESNLTVEEK